uniref:Ribosomal RNA methyltransferase FtsJ domain-containing protein n=1 Tax=viral metagenome TaxID=1070528 RepID=A0A6C0LL90_9ZZZZ
MEDPIYHENNIIVGNKNLSKVLPFKNKISELKEQLEQTRLEWRPYYDLNKDFRRFIQKLSFFDSLKHKLEVEYKIKNATNDWLQLYEILFRFKHIFTKLNNLSVLFNLNSSSEIISALDFFIKKCKNINKYTWNIIQDTGNKNEDLYRYHSDKWIEYRSHLSRSSDNSTPSLVLNISNKVKTIREKNTHNYDIYISILKSASNTYLDVVEDYVQYIIGLSVLKRGGSIIIKMNDIHISFKIWLLATISRYFDNITLLKPLTMRPYMSNTFIIGENFKGISKNDLDKLYYILSSFKRRYINSIMSEVDIDTVQSIYKHIQNSIDREIDIKKRYIKKFNDTNDLQYFYNQLERKTNEVIDNFIFTFEINSDTIY